MKNIIITGGAGFIGSHVVREFVKNLPNTNIINLDALTYAGNLENQSSLHGDRRYAFVQGDIGDKNLIDGLLQRHRPRAVIPNHHLHRVQSETVA